MSTTTDTPRPWYTDEVYPRDGAEIEIKHPDYPDAGRLYGFATSDTEDNTGTIEVVLDDEQPAYDDNDKFMWIQSPEDNAREYIFIWDKARGSWVNESSTEVAFDRMVWRYVVVPGKGDTRHVSATHANDAQLVKVGFHPSGYSTPALMEADTDGDLRDTIHPVDALERLAVATGLPPLDPDKLAKLRAYCDEPVLLNLTSDERLLPNELPIAVFDTFEAARIAASTRISGVTWRVQPQPGWGWSVRINPAYGDIGAWMREVRG